MQELKTESKKSTKVKNKKTKSTKAKSKSDSVSLFDDLSLAELLATDAPDAEASPAVVAKYCCALWSKGNKQHKLTRWKIGKALVQQKDLLAHGDWQDWIVRHLPFSYRTAIRLVNFANKVSEADLESDESYNAVCGRLGVLTGYTKSPTDDEAESKSDKPKQSDKSSKDDESIAVGAFEKRIKRLGDYIQSLADDAAKLENAPNAVNVTEIMLNQFESAIEGNVANLEKVKTTIGKMLDNLMVLKIESRDKQKKIRKQKKKAGKKTKGKKVIV